MKAVILAGGSGTRLQPLTQVTNKHLLPVYDKPVIFYPIEKLVEAGVDKIMIVTSPNSIDGFVKLLGSGERFKSKNSNAQIQIVYGIQNNPGGIAEGLWIAKDYVGQDNCVLWLGDNIVEDEVTEHIKSFKSGLTIFVKEVNDPERFGIAEINAQGKIISIEEKPEKPKSNLAVTGVYIYDNSVFEKMHNQPASARGEKEITYLNNIYVREGNVRSVTLEKTWFDVGTIDSLLEASNYMKQKYRKNGTGL